MSCYSEHRSTDFNISEQERGSVLYLVHIYNMQTLGHVPMVINIANLIA